MISRQLSLSKNMIQFCRFLRNSGFMLNVEDEITVLNSLLFNTFIDRKLFKLTLKAVLCKSNKELNEFENLFNQYWSELGKAIESKVKTTSKPVLRQTAKDDSFKSLKSWLSGNKNEEIEQTASYSIGESLSQKDFSQVAVDELKEIMLCIKALSRKLATNLNRRYKNSNKDKFPDLRKTLRNNMRHGGELLKIFFKTPKLNRVKLVIFCDVSKSMDLYASFFLQFMHAFQQTYSRVETFAFGTTLQHITSYLKQNDISTALSLLSTKSQGWSGGTRIGASLHSFLEEYANHMLDKRTIVIILSDGWDTGAIPLLKKSMELIHHKSRKVIWLNPLAGYKLYRPDVAGMQAALPYIDVFSSVHNIDSLKKLVKWL